jgi:hypothetical protein
MVYFTGARLTVDQQWERSPCDYNTIEECKEYIQTQESRVALWLQQGYTVAILKNKTILYTIDAIGSYKPATYTGRGILKLRPIRSEPSFVSSVYARIQPTRRVFPPVITTVFKCADSSCMLLSNWRQKKAHS